jgi:hypothetical protein
MIQESSHRSLSSFQEDVTPLDEYVNLDDGFWSYDVIQSYDEGDHWLYVLNMTSQKWQDGECPSH